MPSRISVVFIVLLYALATLQFTRFYSKTTTFYLRMADYLNGKERLPFQERILPVAVLRPLFHSAWVTQHLAHENGAFTPQKGPFYLLSLISLVIAGVYTQRLYNLLTDSGSLRILVYPIFLFTVMWTFTIHIEADFSYPYDLPSLAFFTAGLYYIYARRFVPLLVILLIGTFNRETTLFLIGIYLLDAASTDSERGSLAYRFDLRQVPWLQVALLSAIWAAVKISLVYVFRHNDHSEQFLRIHYNLDRMKLRLFPALLNICGYSLPLVVIFFGRLRPVRFANYLFILIPWVVVMFCTGVLVETRIYGELCSFSAVALILILENSLGVRSLAEPSSRRISVHGPASHSVS